MTYADRIRLRDTIIADAQEALLEAQESINNTTLSALDRLPSVAVQIGKALGLLTLQTDPGE